MIWTFILGVVAGWSAPFAEERLKPYLDRYLPGGPVTPVDLRAIALAATILIAAVVAVLTGSSHALALALGVALGVVGPRLWEKFRATQAPDYDS
jgi:hypothetical protein